jgi:hypothetical protein
MRRSIRMLMVAALTLAAMTAGGCRDGEVTTIRALLDDPSQYHRKTVRIAGTVARSIGALGYGAYEVDDGTGTLPVVSQENGAPREGAQVGVEGEFRSAFTLGTRTVAVLVERRRATP